MLTLRIDEQDARDLAFALRVAIDSGHLIDTYARVVELRGRIMSLVYDQADQHAADEGSVVTNEERHHFGEEPAA